MRKLLLIPVTALCAIAQTSNYPGALDTNTSLFVTGDNVQSTLAQAMAAGDNVAFVRSGTGFVANMIITICDVTAPVTPTLTKCTSWEHMLVTNVTGQALTVTRGFAGTSAVSHLSGAVVSVAIDSAHQSSLKSAVIAIETALGPNISNAITNIKSYGAVCNGTDQNTAVQAALSAGATTIFIPRGCLWTAPGGIIPSSLANPITYIGESSLTSVIQSNATPSTTALQLGPGGSIRNVAAVGRTGCFGNVVTPPNCMLPGMAVNQQDVNANIVQTGYNSLVMQVGQAGKDTSGTNVQNHGIGDGIFAAVDTLNGVAARFDLENGTGSAVVIDLNGGDGGSNGLSIVDNALSAAYPFSWSSNYRTSTGVFNLTHGYGVSASTMTGNIFNVSMAQSSGAFTGNFDYFLNSGSLAWRIGSHGQAQQGGVTFAVLNALGGSVPGTFIWCTDCQVATSCTSGGSGAWAFGIAGGAWKCPF